MSITTTLVTAEELAAMGENAPFELIRGELRSVSPTKGWHSVVSARFVFEFGFYSRSVLPGEVFTNEGGYLVERDPDTVVAPDVFFIRRDRLPTQATLKAQFVSVTPDAVVEIRSPSNTWTEIEEKVRIYLTAGVSLVLVADPDRESVRARTPEGRDETVGIDDTLDGGDALPGFRVPVSRFFR